MTTTANILLAMTFTILVFSCASRRVQSDVIPESRPPVIAAYRSKSLDEVPAFFESRKKVFFSMTHPAPDPYFGSRILGPTCDDKKRPAPIETPRSLSLFLFATKTGIFGVCDPAKDVLKTRIDWIYCEKEKEIREIKQFADATRADWPLQIEADCSNSPRD